MFQDTWYEFRVLAVMQDLISEPSNVAGVSSTGEGWLLLSPWLWGCELGSGGCRAVMDVPNTALTPGCLPTGAGEDKSPEHCRAQHAPALR